MFYRWTVLSALTIHCTFAQLFLKTINNTVPIARNVAQQIVKWAYEPSSDSYYAAQYPSNGAKLDSQFNLIWDKTLTSSWDLGNGLGIHSISVHPNGNIYMCGDAVGQVNGVPMPGGGYCDFFYITVDPSGNLLSTKMGGKWILCI